MKTKSLTAKQMHKLCSCVTQMHMAMLEARYIEAAGKELTPAAIERSAKQIQQCSRRAMIMLLKLMDKPPPPKKLSGFP